MVEKTCSFGSGETKRGQMVAKVKHDVVYVVKETSTNPELVYSLRSLEKNWDYRDVWFAGGCPDDLKPDHYMKIKQVGLNKWEKVKYTFKLIFQNDQISEDFWLFNDDFFVLTRPKNLKPEYNGLIEDYIERIKSKNHNSHSEYTLRLTKTIKALEEAGCATLNYEVHKPMLINREKALQILELFPDSGGFRSLYGNYWKIGGVDCNDVKIKSLFYDELGLVTKGWQYLSTSDNSFKNGGVGRFIRDKFNEKSRFERS